MKLKGLPQLSGEMSQGNRDLSQGFRLLGTAIPGPYGVARFLQSLQRLYHIGANHPIGLGRRYSRIPIRLQARAAGRSITKEKSYGTLVTYFAYFLAGGNG